MTEEDETISDEQNENKPFQKQIEYNEDRIDYWEGLRERFMAREPENILESVRFKISNVYRGYHKDTLVRDILISVNAVVTVPLGVLVWLYGILNHFLTTGLLTVGLIFVVTITLVLRGKDYE